MNNPCVFSKDRKHRYSLLHEWNQYMPKCAFIGLNPSTADESQLDPTLARIKNFSQSFGFGGFYILNLFAYRATDPKEMKKMGKDAIGEMNDFWIQQTIQMVDIVVCGWGNNGKFLDRGNQVCKYLREAYAFGFNKNGSPKHPLYLKGTLPLLKFI